MTQLGAIIYTVAFLALGTAAVWGVIEMGPRIEVAE